MLYKLSVESDSLSDLADMINSLNKKLPPVISREPSLSKDEVQTLLTDESGLPLAEPTKRPRRTKQEMQEAKIPVEKEPEIALSEISYEDVKKATLDLKAAKGKDVVIALFDEYGINTALDLKPEQYGEYLGKCATAMKRV